jgi:hypothetical protein
MPEEAKSFNTEDTKGHAYQQRNAADNCLLTVLSMSIGCARNQILRVLCVLCVKALGLLSISRQTRPRLVTKEHTLSLSAHSVANIALGNGSELRSFRYRAPRATHRFPRSNESSPCRPSARPGSSCERKETEQCPAACHRARRSYFELNACEPVHAGRLFRSVIDTHAQVSDALCCRRRTAQR